MSTVSLSTALSGMSAANERLRASANNIANVATPGYHRERIEAETAADGNGVTTRVEKLPTPGEDLATDLVEQLTTREREVLDLMAARKSNQEIADALVISIKTVKSHVANILAKLQIESRYEVGHILSTTLPQR